MGANASRLARPKLQSKFGKELEAIVEWRCSDRPSKYHEGVATKWINYPESVIKHYSPPPLTSKIVKEVWNTLRSYETEWITVGAMGGIQGYSLLKAKALLETCGIRWYPTIHTHLCDLYGSKLVSFLTKK